MYRILKESKRKGFGCDFTWILPYAACTEVYNGNRIRSKECLFVFSFGINAENSGHQQRNEPEIRISMMLMKFRTARSQRGRSKLYLHSPISWHSGVINSSRNWSIMTSFWRHGASILVRAFDGGANDALLASLQIASLWLNFRLTQQILGTGWPCVSNRPAVPSLAWQPSLSLGVPMNAGFLCDKPAVLCSSDNSCAETGQSSVSSTNGALVTAARLRAK